MVRAVQKLLLVEKQLVVNRFKSQMATDDMLRDQGAMVALDSFVHKFLTITEVMKDE